VATDAPFRETSSAIECAKGKGATCVEMEAAALYAFARVKNKQVVCFAHLTNTMAQTEGDFEKGRNGKFRYIRISILHAKAYKRDGATLTLSKPKRIGTLFTILEKKIN
jgi:purine-nucleoside phosphorylase